MLVIMMGIPKISVSINKTPALRAVTYSERISGEHHPVPFNAWQTVHCWERPLNRLILEAPVFVQRMAPATWLGAKRSLKLKVAD